MARHLTLPALLLGLSLSAFAQAQQSKLPPCPPVDYSKNGHIGVGGRTEKWHNCFGRYVAELNDANKGDVYEGEFKDGLYSGQGTYTFVKGTKYVGEYKDGKRNGQGTATFADGGKYVGEWKDEQYNGQGTFTFADGRKYVGEWKDDQYNGQGTYTNPYGQIQEGIWAHNRFVRGSNEPKWELAKPLPVQQQNDVAINEERRKLDADRQAQSKLPPCPPVDYSKKTDKERIREWKNCFGRYVAELNNAYKGDVYEGEFRNGVPSGQGSSVSSRSGNYVGEFKNGKPNGHGTNIFNNGDKYVGEWKDGNKHGNGTYEYSIGNKYIGEFKEGDKHGLGTWTFINGDTYFGDFKDDSYNGKGIFTFANGRPKKEGIFKNGVFVRAEKINLPPVNQQTDVALNEDRRKLDTDRQAQSSLPPCPKLDYTLSNPRQNWHFCFGSQGGYDGEFWNGVFQGQGTFITGKGDKYVGEWKNGKITGKGIYSWADGRVQEGIFENGNFIRAEKITQQTDIAINEERRKLDADRQALEVERQRLTEERNRREQAKQSSKLSLQTTTTTPDANGAVIISVRTNADTSSLKVNGEEQGGRPDGNYIIKKVARVGQDTNYVITAVDSNGNTDSSTISVARQAASSSSNQPAFLKPENIKRAATRDAVAIIIGIQNYKRVPKADFANSDAKEFYEYAIRGLGIKPENIKLLVDEEADDVNIVKAFENWLPLQVNKGKTDVYVFYSGHGLPSSDGKSLYFLPYGVDKELLSRTAVGQAEVVSALVASKPKSVTMFIDACYSGQTRGGETLLASAKPLALKTDTNAFPSNFTVISASANDQISSSSPELKHGIFSFYLMKGMEGDADGNKDGKITTGEMQEYLSDKVSRQAMSMSRKQDTQLVGDANKVLMGR